MGLVSDYEICRSKFVNFYNKLQFAVVMRTKRRCADTPRFRLLHLVLAPEMRGVLSMWLVLGGKKRSGTVALGAVPGPLSFFFSNLSRMPTSSATHPSGLCRICEKCLYY